MEGLRTTDICKKKLYDQLLYLLIAYLLDNIKQLLHQLHSALHISSTWTLSTKPKFLFYFDILCYSLFCLPFY